MNRSSWWHKPLLIVHVAAAVSLIGADLVLVALGVSGVNGADPNTVFPAAYLLEVWVVAPLVVIALGTGVLQVALSGWEMLRYWWVAIKLTTTVVFTVLIVVVLIPRLAASADAALAGETFGTADRLPLALVPALAIAVLLLNVALAIYQPNKRIPGRSNAHDVHRTVRT